MIDEKKLIELLEDEILRIDTESTPGCGNLYGRDASVMKNTLNFVIDLINEQPKIGEWIPVEERLPEEEAEFELERRKCEAIMLKYGRRTFKYGKHNYFIVIFDKRMIIESASNLHIYYQGTIYFDSEELAQTAMNEIGEERLKKYVFRVEE